MTASSRHRKIFCNRTLNLRSIRAIGYDMDYTLIHYVVREWERHAFDYVKGKLQDRGWPVDGLTFDESIIRGLVVDREHGNLLKANRFGYVKRAYHGTQPIPFDEMRRAYSRTIVDLEESRWRFMNTFFSLSEACLYMQLVDRLDARQLPDVMGYEDLHRIIREAMDYAHMEGRLKAEVIANPKRFIERDPETPLALLDQKYAGKKLLLITNSEWDYTMRMMEYAFDPHLPTGMTWRELFDVIIVSARKPLFFEGKNSLFEVVNDDGLLRPAHELKKDGIYLGGSVEQVEAYLGADGEQILYMGDHIFGDVHVSKKIQRWRTGLVVRELEDEIRALEGFEREQEKLSDMMRQKEALEVELATIRLSLQRLRKSYGPQPEADAPTLEGTETQVKERLMALDDLIAPLARGAGEVSNSSWGLLMRAGNDKSHLARQIERYADIYTSRVSNFLAHSPFKYLRSSRGSLPHDS